MKNNTATTASSSSSNRLFLIFLVLSAIIAVININFHHILHTNEHVHDKSLRQFRHRFKTSRTETSNGGDDADDEQQQQQQKKVVEAKKTKTTMTQHHKLAGLQCNELYGGPTNDTNVEKEMSYWLDIPSDATYRSPFMDSSNERYLTFEPDHGGWNNIRMAMETAVVMSHAMGRTLVLPPEQRFYLLNKNSATKNDANAQQQQHKTEFDFGDFFHLDSIALEHVGFNIITTEEFLHRLGSQGKLLNIHTQQPEIWNEDEQSTPQSVKEYLTKVGINPMWDPMKCIASIPATVGEDAILELQIAHSNIMTEATNGHLRTIEEYINHPTSTNGTIQARMREMLVDRDELCIYTTQLQQAQVLYFPVAKGTRLLTHFYAFIFFANWTVDLWSKRFVRDHLRYIDEIICAAGRIVEAVRLRSSNKGNGDGGGMFDSMHIRRGDFQYKKTRLSAPELLERSKGKLHPGGVVYIATDERDKSFFDPFRLEYDIVFLDDYKHVLHGINENYYGMLDQLVASKGRVFIGTFFSTLSGYINRMRGYYMTKHKIDGYLEGVMESYYFTPDDRVNQMRQYMAVKKPIYMREFPISWRDIDKGIDELHVSMEQ
jgi:hypothetical protein